MTRRNPSQGGSRTKSRRVAENLSPWHKEQPRSLYGSWLLAVWLLKNYTALYFDQVSYQPNHISPLFTNLDFFFLIFSPGWKVFSLIISTLYDFLVFLPIPLIGWEVFHQLISCPVFLLSLPIIGLRGFLPATWPFEIYQLPYGTTMFSVVSRSSSLVSLIRLEGFSPGSHFLSTIPCSMELVSEERSNCNNVTLEIESFRSGSHVTTIIQNFTLISLTSTIILHQVWLPFGASSPLLDLRTRRFLLCPRLFFTLCIWLLTVYATELARHLGTSWKDIPLGYLQIVYLLRYETGSSLGVT